MSEKLLEGLILDRVYNDEVRKAINRAARRKDTISAGMIADDVLKRKRDPLFASLKFDRDELADVAKEQLRRRWGGGLIARRLGRRPD